LRILDLNLAVMVETCSVKVGAGPRYPLYRNLEPVRVARAAGRGQGDHVGDLAFEVDLESLLDRIKVD
jgi:hypothetical protein